MLAFKRSLVREYCLLWCLFALYALLKRSVRESGLPWFPLLCVQPQGDEIGREEGYIWHVCLGFFQSWEHCCSFHLGNFDMYRYFVARFEAFAVVLLMIHVFRGVTLYHWINSSHNFEGNAIFRICGTVSPVPHCNIPEYLNLPSHCRCLPAKWRGHIFQTSNSPWCVVCFSELLGKMYLFLYFIVCRYY